MPFIRQTPLWAGIFNQIRFIENKEIERCDYWVVYDDLRSVEDVICPQKNTILITGEPPCIKTYDPLFLKQFGSVISPHQNLNHPNIINYQPALPWHIGRKIINSEMSEYPLNFDELLTIDQFDKPRLLSAVVSSKTKTRDQKQRLKFIKLMIRRSSLTPEIFGTGINRISDKWDAIAPYKYHLVFENCAVPDYFSEKLSDTYLGGAYPFYFGCTNISRYFPPDSYSKIDIYDINKSIEIIEKKIERTRYEDLVESVFKARNLVLMKYNFFALISNCINRNPVSSSLPAERIIIHPQDYYTTNSLPGKMKGIIRSLLMK